jgi:hypothetical protein
MYQALPRVPRVPRVPRALAASLILATLGLGAPVTGSGRYVRMYGTKRSTGYGYSLWEFQVYGS